MSTLHSDLATTNLHVPGYRQDSDPGAVGAGKYWVDSSGGTGAWVLKVRNAGDTDWEEIASGGGSSTFHGARVKRTSTQSITAGAFATVNAFDSEDFDTDTYHFTSAAALTGTVTKTASSTTLTGSGTSFTTELSVGQVISVPGTAAEVRVVTAIGSNTSLTVNTAFANSAAGQTATRVSSAIAIPSSLAGYHQVGFQGALAAGAGETYGRIILNGNTSSVIATNGGANGSANEVTLNFWNVWNFSAWDYIEVQLFVTNTRNFVAANNSLVIARLGS